MIKSLLPSLFQSPMTGLVVGTPKFCRGTSETILPLGLSTTSASPTARIESRAPLRRREKAWMELWVLSTADSSVMKKFGVNAAEMSGIASKFLLKNPPSAALLLSLLLSTPLAEWLWVEGRAVALVWVIQLRRPSSGL